MIRFMSFSDRDFRYVSLAFLKATIVAVSPAFGTGDVDRPMGDKLRSTEEGTRPPAVAGFHDDERVAIARSSRIVVVIGDGSANRRKSCRLSPIIPLLDCNRHIYGSYMR